MSKTEPLPTLFQGTIRRQRGPGGMRGRQVDLGHHRLVAGGEFVLLERGQGVLVGIGE